MTISIPPQFSLSKDTRKRLNRLRIRYLIDTVRKDKSIIERACNIKNVFTENKFSIGKDKIEELSDIINYLYMRIELYKKEIFKIFNERNSDALLPERL